MKRAMAWTGWVVAGVLLVTTPVVAQAGALITGKDVKNGSLTSADLRRGAVKSGDIAKGAVKRADLGERVRPPKTQVYEVYEFTNGPIDASTYQVSAFARDVAPYTLVEAIDIELDVASRCENGTGELKLGVHVIARYELASGEATMFLESGDTGSARKNLVFRFTCSERIDQAGGSVYVTYQLTRRNLDQVVEYDARQ